MTQKEYQRLSRQARNKATGITNSARREILKAFEEAGQLAAKAVRDTTAAGLSDLTSAGWAQINGQLNAGAQLVGQSVELNTPIAISKAYKNYANIDVEYIMDAVIASGNTLITEEGLRSIVVGIDNALVQATANRLHEDGFTFSDRIWSQSTRLSKDGITQLPRSVYTDYQFRIKNLILTGQAQGRDSIDVAKDIQLYISRGENVVFRPGRYGRLIPGTAEYRRRITGTVDWRALRIIRSEMSASLQEAGKLEGLLNPASQNSYNWIKNSGNPIDKDGSNNASGKRCIDLMDDNPYTLETVPSYQHANCGCAVVPNLMDQREFVSALKTWVPGAGNVPYLDSWYRSVYIPGQSFSL